MLRSALRVTVLALTLALPLVGFTVVVAPGAAQAASRECTPAPAADLARCDFSGADLSFADLAGSDLRGANLSQTNLNGTNLTGADLTGADLQGAGIVQDCVDDGVVCPFTQTGILGLGRLYETSPDFTDADLRGADLDGVSLGEVDIPGSLCLPNKPCIIYYSVYPPAVLTGVRSGGIVGTPSTLPAGWQLVDGYLTPVIAPPVITTMSLPAGSLGTAYSATLAAGGGNPPYRWSVTGALPPGLRIHRTLGTITGKPRASGTYPFTVVVTDTRTAAPPHTQRTATQPLSITIP